MKKLFDTNITILFHQAAGGIGKRSGSQKSMESNGIKMLHAGTFYHPYILYLPIRGKINKENSRKKARDLFFLV